MQANYPKKLSTISWDTLNIQYPVRKFPSTGDSSETIGRRWRRQPEVLRDPYEQVPELREYNRDFNLANQLSRSQTTLDYASKLPEIWRFNKNTSSTENRYIYSPSRQLADRPPALTAHGTSEMRSSYTPPAYPCNLVTDKDQYKHPASLPLDPPQVEPFHKEKEPLDTTHEGFEKYLDPYLTTSRLHHRPFTAEQLCRPSNSRDVLTYYSYSDSPWVWTTKPSIDKWRLPTKRPKSMYDRQKFKEDFREIRTHNKHNLVPGTFRTEIRDNYVLPTAQLGSNIHNYEEDARTFYQRAVASFPPNIQFEYSSFKEEYTTENSQIGSRIPICGAINQYVEKNKRLATKSLRNG